MCEQRVRVSGSFADYTVVPISALHRKPDGCDTHAVVLAEPLSCAIYAFDRANFRVDDSAAIIGAGTIGLLLLMLARRAGARNIMVSDPNAAKRRLAERLGADVTVDPTSEDLDAATRRLLMLAALTLHLKPSACPGRLTTRCAPSGPGGGRSRRGEPVRGLGERRSVVAAAP